MVVDHPLPSSFLNFMVSPQVLIQMTRILLNQGVPVQRTPLEVRSPLLCDRLVSVLQSQKYPWCVTGPLIYHEKHSNSSPVHPCTAQLMLLLLCLNQLL